ncbi:MAG: ORF6N domain-containing protein [Bacteriovoracaceae bacterium]|nr:ORF6N domain-containing protein [Bacteriovoracaceae bacterium]
MQPKIFTIRDQKVMLDYQLGELYGVPTKRLNEAVKRNIERFPEHYMFQLTSDELEHMWSQFATTYALNNRKYVRAGARPYVFTEHGVLMLASVLKSERATQISIAIVDIFVKLRDHYNDPLLQRVHRLEQESAYVMKLFDDVFKRLHQIQESGLPKRQKKIGLK